MLHVKNKNLHRLLLLLLQIRTENGKTVPKVGTVLCAGKHTCDPCKTWYNAWENMPLVPSMRLILSAVKQATRVKRWKKCDLCIARENMPPVQWAGKHDTGAKHATDFKRGKTSD